MCERGNRNLNNMQERLENGRRDEHFQKSWTAAKGGSRFSWSNLRADFRKPECNPSGETTTWRFVTTTSTFLNDWHPTIHHTDQITLLNQTKLTKQDRTPRFSFVLCRFGGENVRFDISTLHLVVPDLCFGELSLGDTAGDSATKYTSKYCNFITTMCCECFDRKKWKHLEEGQVGTVVMNLLTTEQALVFPLQWL